MKYNIFTIIQKNIMYKKLILIIFALILIGSAAKAQDTMYFYKSGTIVDKLATTEIDSITFHDPNLSNHTLMFVGTYTSGSSKGIYEYEFDALTGKLSLKGTTTSSNPSFITIHPNRKWLYAANENSSGTVTAYSIDTALNKLSLLNSQSSNGNSPCNVSVDFLGKNVMVANYNSGSFASYTIGTDGKLSAAVSIIQDSGKSPHAHMIAQGFGNGLVYGSDLGIDKLRAFSLNAATGALTATSNGASISAGYGPRHFACHPNNKFIYIITELKGTVEVYSYNDTTQQLSFVQSISTLPSGVTATASSADIHITPNGKYLYASNRGTNNNIAIYSIDTITGQLTLLGHQSTKGTTPRNFCIHPSGKWLLVANMDSNNIVVFKIDPATGLLTYSGNTITIPNPVCIKFW